MSIDFSKLVPVAQKGDKKAMEGICIAFRPLILNLGYKKRYAVLEDNVESISYCAIIQLVRNYAGSTYQHFPGYIKKMLIFSLNNAAKKQQRISYYEANSIDGLETLSPLFSDNEEEHNIERIMLEQAIKKMPLQYRQLLKCYYWKNETDKEIGRQMGISQQAVSKMRKKVLQEIRTIMG
jgi:RNA polymerase sigma factor (sigma-70 family)